MTTIRRSDLKSMEAHLQQGEKKWPQDMCAVRFNYLID